MSARAMKRRCFWPPGKIHEPGVALVGEAELFEQVFGIDGFFLVKRGPQVDRFPHFDALL